MYPTVHSGDHIVVHLAYYDRDNMFDNIKVGDFITFTTHTGEKFFGKNHDANGCIAGNKIGHRVVGEALDDNGERFLITKGDNNTQSYPDLDYPVYKDQLIGVVVEDLDRDW